MMTKVAFVTCLISLSICFTYAYQRECAIGPAYWCKSFQNAQDCGALHHCTDTVWRYDEKRTTIDSSTKCEWCEKILENTHKAIQNVANNEDLIKSTLLNGCKMLPLEDISSKCTNVIEMYGTTVLSLMKSQRYDRLCRLMDICPSSELKTNEEQINSDVQSKMLCNVIVRATQELHVNQQKTRSDIQTYLKNDCQHLGVSQLIKKCENLIERHGNDIYAHVASGVELSNICDYIDDFNLQSGPQIGCDACTFIVANARRMLDINHSEDQVLNYIDQQMCSRLTGTSKKNCKQVIDSKGRDLISNIKNGAYPMLVCTHFTLCFDRIVDETNTIQKDEMRSFLMNNICEKLGSLKTACQALIKKDTTVLLQILINDINGRELCKMFGLCQNASLLTYKSNVQDDPSQCKRCITDFTRRKHIAEKLVNHSSEFLHHLCGQLPQKDDCLKAVDDSINELVTFIRSLDPREICVQLKMCNETSSYYVKMGSLISSDDSIKDNIIEYIKSDVCTKLGSLNSFCRHLADTEGLGLLDLVGKTIDPHQVCSILDVCPSNSVLKVCNDKCQCCTNKLEIYVSKLKKFLEAMVGNARVVCDQVPVRDTCLQLVDKFETNSHQFITRFDSKRSCQSLSFCTDAKKPDEDQCRTCLNEINQRQRRFQITMNEVTIELLSLCSDNDCRDHVQSKQQDTLNKINNINADNLCQRLDYCTSENTNEPSSTLLRLKSLAHYQTKTLDERLKAHEVCSEYGQLKPMCEHLLASPLSPHYAYVYMAILQNNPQLINDHLREQVANGKVDTCDSCKNLLESSKDFLNNALESALDILLPLCDRLPLKDQCRNFINQRFNNIESYVNNIDSQEFCTSLGLCQVSSLCKTMGGFEQACKDALHVFTQSVQRDSQTLEKHLPHTSIVVLPSKIEEKTDILSDSNSTCILCQYLMQILSNYIHQQSTEKEIEESLEKICNKMPATVKNQCHELVENYGPPIIAILLQEFNISTVCQKLNLCTKQMKVQDTSYLTRANEAACGICDYVSTYINFALKRDSSDRSLQHALASVCKHLSNEQQTQCETLVQLVGPHARKLELDLNKNFCQQLTICEMPMIKLRPAITLKDKPKLGKDEQFKQAILKNLDSTPECMLCHYVVSYLDAVLKNNKSAEAIEAALSRVCSILPRKERPRCDEFVKTYGPVLAELIADTADPDAVCRYLGLCQVVATQETTTATTTMDKSAPINY